MLSIQDQGTAWCDGLTRRDWLRIGSLGMLGLTLPALLQARQAEAASSSRGRTGKARSCIVLFFLGGPPQHETWDPKPRAPVEIRGDLKPIASAVPGVQVGELMPKTARLTDKICILRGVATDDNAHSSSGYYMTTGYPHQPKGVENAKPGAPNDWPCLGALVKLGNRVRAAGRNSGGLPTAITLPEQTANDGNLTWPGQDAGFLGRGADPWLLNGDPSAADFQIEGLTLTPDVTAGRLAARRSLARQVNQRLDAVIRSGASGHFDALHRRALNLISASQARRAFHLHEEPLPMRARYGRTRFGQSVLLARRLVEAGVPLIRVNWTRVPGAFNNGHWDTHSKNTGGLKQLMPIMDQAYSALLEDLGQRGLLDETLVVWMGEFGRTPRINGAAGRDHWGHVFSVALAGGGVRGGVVHGASDSIGGHPRDGQAVPQDLLATILHCLGIRPDTEIRDGQGRPLPLCRGEVIRQVV
jgi:hypothetical protein